MRVATLLFLALLGAWTCPPRSAAADLALVLLTDVSNSMDDADFALVKAGYQSAFSDPEVIAALMDNPGGVAVAYVEFSGADQVTLVKGWDLLTDAASAQAFGAAVAAAPRSSSGNTALAAGMRQATALLLDAQFDDTRRVIDVVSDHPRDGGRAVGVRDDAVAAGITINALPIVNDRPIGTYDGRMTYSVLSWYGGITEFYRRDIIGGPGSFVIEARDYAVFGEALRRKLLRELISDTPSPMRTAAAVR
jgi:hypothetical protein